MKKVLKLNATVINNEFNKPCVRLDFQTFKDGKNTKFRNKTPLLFITRKVIKIKAKICVSETTVHFLPISFDLIKQV